jgi:hypothetical protein
LYVVVFRERNARVGKQVTHMDALLFDMPEDHVSKNVGSEYIKEMLTWKTRSTAPFLANMSGLDCKLSFFSSCLGTAL